MALSLLMMFGTFENRVKAKPPGSQEFSGSPPISLEDEGAPVGWIAKTGLARQREARLAESGGGMQAIDPHRAIEHRHQRGGRAVVDPPEAGHHPRRSRLHEA